MRLPASLKQRLAEDIVFQYFGEVHDALTIFINSRGYMFVYALWILRDCEGVVAVLLPPGQFWISCIPENGHLWPYKLRRYLRRSR
jgi:hypothetical protein